MTCSQTEKVSLLIDGELKPAEVAQVELHLKRCADCREAHESFLLLRGQLDNYESPIDAAATAAALAEVLSQSPATKPALVTPTWRERLATVFATNRSFAPRFAAVAALLIMAVAIGVIALFMQQGTPSDIAKVAQQSKTTSTSSSANGDAAKPQAQKGGNEQTPATQGTKETKPKPSQTPARNIPRPQRRRTERVPNYSAIEDNVAANTPAPNQLEVGLTTARHLEQSELLLRAFRNVRSVRSGQSPDISYERERAQKLLYQNILIRREADAKGDVQVATLLNSLEPILLDIANLKNKPGNEEVTAIKDRVERKSLVPLLQINSAAVARAYE